MQVYQSSEPWRGVRAEDVYIVVNDQGVQCGCGYVVCNYSPSIYPERPVRLYFTMECTPEAEYMLFGALIGHARQLRQQYPHRYAYVYTDVHPKDSRLLNFCLHNGLQVFDAEEVVRLTVPNEADADSFGCNFSSIPLNTVQSQNALIARMARNELYHITPAYLQALAANPFFMVLGLFVSGNGEPVAECIISGAPGCEPELAAIYVDSGYRGNSLGTKLLRRALTLCGTNGVRSIQARVMTASQPQMRLMRRFGAESLCQTLLLPGKEL